MKEWFMIFWLSHRRRVNFCLAIYSVWSPRGERSLPSLHTPYMRIGSILLWPLTLSAIAKIAPFSLFYLKPEKVEGGKMVVLFSPLLFLWPNLKIEKGVAFFPTLFWQSITIGAGSSHPSRVIERGRLNGKDLKIPPATFGNRGERSKLLK